MAWLLRSGGAVVNNGIVAAAGTVTCDTRLPWLSLMTIVAEPAMSDYLKTVARKRQRQQHLHCWK